MRRTATPVPARRTSTVSATTSNRRLRTRSCGSLGTVAGGRDDATGSSEGSSRRAAPSLSGSSSEGSLDLRWLLRHEPGRGTTLGDRSVPCGSVDSIPLARTSPRRLAVDVVPLLVPAERVRFANHADRLQEAPHNRRKQRDISTTTVRSSARRRFRISCGWFSGSGGAGDLGEACGYHGREQSKVRRASAGGT